MYEYPAPSREEVLALRKDVDNLAYEEVRALATMIGHFHRRDAVSDPDGSFGSVRITQLQLQGLLLWAMEHGPRIMELARHNEALLQIQRAVDLLGQAHGILGPEDHELRDRIAALIFPPKPDEGTQ